MQIIVDRDHLPGDTPSLGYVVMCAPLEYGFLPVLASNWASILTILV